MKKLIYTSILALLLAGAGALRAEDWPDEYLGLPGDNLNLYAVMDLFQKSETLEEFERNLNDENSRINNLDLNGDNLVDYIMVQDYADGDVHNIVLRVALNDRENQDVAVFIVEKLSNGSVAIQLIGDEALYGKNYIIEPNYAETPNPGYMGNPHTNNVTIVTTSYWDIARWPMVVYIYRPAYVPWHSAWYWGYWPSWWYGWSPYYWHYYYGYHYNWFPHYYSYYHHWDHYRGHWYNDYYYNRVRVYSPTVVVNVHKNYYRNTYSHPEMRSEGEAHGARAYAERDSRTQYNTNVSRDDRRTVNQTTGNENRVKTGTSTTDRRTTGTVNNGSRTYSTTGRSTGTTSRSTTTGTVKSDRTYSTGRTTGTTRSTDGNIKNNSNTNGSSGRTTGNTSRTNSSSTTYRSSNSSSSGRSYGTTSKPTSTVNKSTGSDHRSSSSGSYKSSGGSSSSRSSGSVSKSGSTSSSRSSGSVSKSGSSDSHKSTGNSSSGRSSSGSRSASDKSSSSHSRR